jgi:N-acetylated-alpha-linked acidic dipeptidase
MKQLAGGRLPIFVTAALASFLASFVAAASGGEGKSQLLGFTPDGAASQLSLEQRFDGQLNPTELRDWLKRLASGANQVGAPHNKENAEFVRDQFRSWGWDAQIEQFDVLYPTLKRHTLELVAPTKYVATLNEPALAGDETSTRTDAMPPYHAYGGDGDVTADLVYVNYGMPEDYKDLARRGVDVKGKIVLARYGQGWRGLKPKLAYEHGAVGCLVYSDPADDGYSAGDVYPKGGFRPSQSVQRGSVADMPIYPGDPLTPGVGATSKAKRLSLAQAKTVLKIPVMPISYGDAQPLLAALEGPVAPAGWRGGLPVTYHIGPGPAKVHLAIESDWSQKPLYDVIARIPGTEYPDEWVVRGNHRDAWVYGAWDPLSGHVAMLAEAKSIGALLKSGWKPKRTLVYASWDGEEPGLLGSTEWVETHADELQKKAVLYVNSDTNTRGFLSADGSHSLQRFMNEVAASVKDPETGVTVQERLRARWMARGYEKGAGEPQKKAAKNAAEGGDLWLGALGSGSDFSPFLQHLGLAALNVEYSGEDDQGGVYHSSYDTFEHYVRFGDPQFAYGIAEAQTVGRTVLRMADAGVLPMQFAGFADMMSDYLDELHKLTDEKRKKSEDLAKLLDKNVFALAADPTRVVSAPEREPEVPYLDFAPLDNVMARLKRSAKAYDEAYARMGTLTPAKRKELNAQLRGLEQTLAPPKGLPGREWYRHLVYAPGLLTGYGVKTLPGVREAIEDNRFDEANQYVVITAAAFSAYCDQLEKATKSLQPPGA